MSSIEKEIEEIKKEIRETPYNKSTEQHIGRLKAKLAKLKEEKVEKSKKQSGGEGYGIEKSGDATVILVGFPSVGKSTLLNSLTKAGSKVADYEFTTLKVIPGTLKYRGARIQILDVPGIISGASEGKGRGKEIMSVMRNADLMLLMIEPSQLDQYQVIKKELYDAGIRLNQSPPKVKIRKKDSGGLDIDSTVDLEISENEIKAILRENGIINADVSIREKLDSDRLIDSIMRNREYLPGLVLVNKIDLLDDDQLKEVQEFVEEKIDEDTLYISAKSGELGELKEKIYENLGFIRIYLKPQGEKADMDEPLVLKKEATVEDLCKNLHKDFLNKF
ncbi:MAG: 50S ribosome-binding GTPase, partial [Hadesarchaea archaeon]|nr:50S ribosome-binding GTPase [Hadesarchaea archaeon]